MTSRLLRFSLILAMSFGVSASAWAQNDKPAAGAPSADAKTKTQDDSKDEDAGKAAEKEKPEAKKVKIGGVQWYVDYDAALKVAKDEEKLMWLHFGENPG
ncbi:MAG: hypothetical protein AAF483_01335 [Planctomycetota bacterium]